MLREETLTSRSIVGIGNVGVTIGKVGAVIRTGVDEDYVQGPFCNVVKALGVTLKASRREALS